MTRMVKIKPDRNRTDEELIGPAMSAHKLLVNPELAVTVAVLRAGPTPAFTRSAADDLELKRKHGVIGSVIAERIAMSQPAAVVNMAEAAGHLAEFVASIDAAGSRKTRTTHP